MGAMSEQAIEAPAPPVLCAECEKGDNGRGICPNCGKLGGCQWGIRLKEPPTRKRVAAPTQPPAAKTPPNIQRAAQPDKAPYYNTVCPICGKTAAKMPAGMHCPQHRAVVCMAHCYVACGFMDKETGHCRFRAQAEQKKAARIR